MQRRLRGLNGIAAILLWWLALYGCGGGQALPQWQPPALAVRDANGFFNKDSGTLKRISTRLLQLEADHGFRVLLVVEPVLIASSAPELAAVLQQEWLPAGNGLVVVYEADSRKLGYGRDVAGQPDPQAPASRIPTHEMAALLDRATTATDQQLAPEAYLEALMDNLVLELRGYFERRKEPPPRDRSLRLALLVVGGLSLLALGALLAAALSRLPALSGTRAFHFPPVKLPERLGAPAGGGKVVTRAFRPPQ